MDDAPALFLSLGPTEPSTPGLRPSCHPQGGTWGTWYSSGVQEGWAPLCADAAVSRVSRIAAPKPAGYLIYLGSGKPKKSVTRGPKDVQLLCDIRILPTRAWGPGYLESVCLGGGPENDDI